MWTFETHLVDGSKCKSEVRLMQEFLENESEKTTRARELIKSIVRSSTAITYSYILVKA